MNSVMGVSRHAQERAVLRLGRDLTRSEWLAAILAIVERRAVLLCRQDDMSEIYLVAVASITARVVWNPFQAQIVTVLPNDTTSLSPAAENARNGEDRQSFVRFAFFRRGKRRPGGTVWERP